MRLTVRASGLDGPRRTEDERLLARVVERQRLSETTTADSWRVFRIMGEVVEGFSNALWTYAIAGLAVLGLDPFDIPRPLGLACAAAAPRSWWSSRRP